MTVLTPPRAVFQFGDPSPRHNDLCGPCSIAEWATAVGHPTTPDQVDAWGIAHGVESPQGLTNVNDLAAMAQAFIPGSRAVPMANNLGDLESSLAAGHYVIVGVTSDGLGRPTPGSTIGHWVLAYGLDRAGVHIANSGSGKLETWQITYFEACLAGELGALQLMPPTVAAPVLLASIPTRRRRKSMDIVTDRQGVMHLVCIGLQSPDKSWHAWALQGRSIDELVVAGGVDLGGNADEVAIGLVADGSVVYAARGTDGRLWFTSTPYAWRPNVNARLGDNPSPT